MKKIVIIIAAIIFCLSGINANEPVMNDHKNENSMVQVGNLILHDVPYGESPRQKLDVFLPEGISSMLLTTIVFPFA